MMGVAPQPACAVCLGHRVAEGTYSIHRRRQHLQLRELAVAGGRCAWSAASTAVTTATWQGLAAPAVPLRARRSAPRIEHWRSAPKIKVNQRSATDLSKFCELARPQTTSAVQQVNMVLPPVSEMKFTKDYPSLKICVTGAGGFIASHLAKRLKEEGHYVRAVDWKENEYMQQSTFCDEFLNLDLRFPDACKQACEGMDWCFNLAVSPLALGHAHWQ